MNKTINTVTELISVLSVLKGSLTFKHCIKFENNKFPWTFMATSRKKVTKKKLERKV